MTVDTCFDLLLTHARIATLGDDDDNGYGLIKMAPSAASTAELPGSVQPGNCRRVR